MPILYAFPIGPIHNEHVDGTIVFGLLDGEVVVPDVGPDPDAALRKLRRLVPASTTLLCDPELETLGAQHGYRAAPSEGIVSIMRVQVALALATDEDVPDRRANVFGLTVAASQFWHARPWIRLNSGQGFTMRVTTRAPRYWEGRLLFGESQAHGQGVALYDPPGSARAVMQAFNAGNLAAVSHVNMVSMLLSPEPDWAAREIGRFTGMALVPKITCMAGATRSAPTAADVLTLMATLGSLAMLGPEKYSCDVDLRTLGVSANLSLRPPRVLGAGAT